jgi:hypothetical protein
MNEIDKNKLAFELYKQATERAKGNKNQVISDLKQYLRAALNGNIDELIKQLT